MFSFVKVLLQVPCEDGSVNTEGVWTHDLGDDTYQIDNCVFLTDSIANGDVIWAPLSDKTGMPTFKGIVSKSDNRIVRVNFDVPALPGSKSAAVLKHLVSLGCKYEGANLTYVMVTVPPSASLDTVINYLNEQKVDLELAEATKGGDLGNRNELLGSLKFARESSPDQSLQYATVKIGSSQVSWGGPAANLRQPKSK